jgi:hypothetical protein
MRKTCGVGAKHGEIRRRITADDSGGNASAVDECDASVLRALDDVLVGEDVTVRCDDDARARAAARMSGVIFAAAAHINTDDRGADGVDRADYCG